MFQLDDKFLADVGLDAMPEELRKPFLQLTYKQLEDRVGIRLSEGMSDEQLDEFGDIIARKAEVVDAWLAQNAPKYQEEEIYKRLSQVSGLPVGDPGLKAEYAATRWLEVNRPDYREVVARTLNEIKQEISKHKDAILGGAAPASAAGPPAQAA